MLFTVLGVIALFLRERNINSTVSGQDERFDRQGELVMVPPVTNSDGREIGDWCEDSSLHLEEQINVQTEEPSLEEPVDGQSEEPSLVEPDSVHGEEPSLVEPDSVHGEEPSLVEPDSVHGEEQSLVEPDSVHGEEQSLVEPDSVHGEEQSLVEPDSVHGEEQSLVEPDSVHSEDSAISSSSNYVPPNIFYAESSSSDDFPQEIYSAGFNCSSELTASSYSSFFSAESGCGNDASTDFLSAESGCGEDASTDFLSAESGCGEDASTDFLSAESGCGDDPSTDFLSAESGCGDDPSPNVVSAEPGCSHDLPPNVVSPKPGCSHDLPPNVFSPKPGCSHDLPPNVVSPKPGCSHDLPPNVVSPKPGCSHDPPPNVVSAKPGCSHDLPPNVVSPKPGCKDDVTQGATRQTKGTVPPQPKEQKNKDTHIIEINSQRYEIGAELGKGGFGTVFAGTRLEDGLQVAVKIADFKAKRYIRVDDFDQPLPSEIALHFLATKGPEVKELVQLLDWKEESDRYFMVLERPIPCVSVREFLRGHQGRIPEDVLRKIMFQATIAADTCCKRGVLHRDIKPGNLLINPETYEVKLIDFGCGELLIDGFYRNYWGTMKFSPPEFKKTGYYCGEPATVWSLGILQFLLIML
ncbi:serine/threonine-protein kinase spk-1-like [Danio aesculapii]|uniref:serine/threonine-protein kinase spk-1-like n=1 Tax=Danio aesculapii TaxID=1142201 RepID=UPI0024BFD45A|nr:serine/threonine-protein kinase spk-1-like [Danio aesculapii]